MLPGYTAIVAVWSTMNSKDNQVASMHGTRDTRRTAQSTMLAAPSLRRWRRPSDFGVSRFPLALPTPDWLVMGTRRCTEPSSSLNLMAQMWRFTKKTAWTMPQEDGNNSPEAYGDPEAWWPWPWETYKGQSHQITALLSLCNHSRRWTRHWLHVEQDMGHPVPLHEHGWGASPHTLPTKSRLLVFPPADTCHRCRSSISPRACHACTGPWCHWSNDATQAHERPKPAEASIKIMRKWTL